MPVGSNTRPEQIVDKNGKPTTVHKGRASAAPATGSSRINGIVRPLLPAKAVPQPLAKGSHFYAANMDSMLKYVITKVNGNAVETVSEDEYEGGQVRLFTRNEAQRGLNYEAAMKDNAAKQNHFWESREDGEIVHYHDGFGQFVRGEIVTTADGEKKMQPIALIGNWKNEVSRSSNGEIHYGHHAKRIVNPSDDSTFRPNDSNMWESMSEESRQSPKYDFIREAGGIENVQPVDLSIPEMTPQEEHAAQIVKKESELSSAASGYDGTSIAERIANVRRIADELEALENSKP